MMAVSMSFLHQPGNLAETPLAAVLIEALNLRASGVLLVAHGGGTSRLWIRDGRPVAAQVFAGFKPLGMMLLQAGLIDIDALSRSLARMAESRRPQGEILVEMGAVSADAVGRMLEEQQAGYFRLIAALDEAAFEFDAATPVPEWTRGARLSPVRTIVDALERPQADALVASALQSVLATGVRLSPAYPEVADAFRWTDSERAIVAQLERSVALDALFAAAGTAVPPERTRAIVAGLVLLGLAAAAPAGDAADEVTGGIAIGREDVTGHPSPPAPSAPAGAARRSDPAEARARRQRLLQQAMRNMGVGPFAGRPPARADAPASRAAPRPLAIPEATDAEAKLRETLLAVAPQGREKDLFARLGVSDAAGREDVKKAFLALARQFHPDRFSSPALADLQDVVKDFFASVNEAYEVLSDDRKRAAYLSDRRGADRANADAARIDFQKAEACMRTRDFARARGFLESAMRADPRAEYQAALALAIVFDPATKDRSRAKALVQEASRDPACDRAAFAAGVIARLEGDDGTAERHFRAAVKANPRNSDASRELRLLEARRAEKRR
jgi:curved DNA-binding protein CbpA